MYAKVRIFSEKCKNSSFFYVSVSFFPLPPFSPFRISLHAQTGNSFRRCFFRHACLLSIFSVTLPKRPFRGKNQIRLSCVFLSALFHSNLRPFTLRFGCFCIAIAMLSNRCEALFTEKFRAFYDIFHTSPLYIRGSKAYFWKLARCARL